MVLLIFVSASYSIINENNNHVLNESISDDKNVSVGLNNNFTNYSDIDVSDQDSQISSNEITVSDQDLKDSSYEKSVFEPVKQNSVFEPVKQNSTENDSRIKVILDKDNAETGHFGPFHIDEFL